MALFNLARMTVSSSGNGTITLSNAVSGFLTFDLAGCSTASGGQAVTYAINDTTQSEIGTGTYTSSSKTLTRGPLATTNSNAAIQMSNAAQVFITPAWQDFPILHRQVFTSSGTFTTPTLMSTAVVFKFIITGGGGGGGGAINPAAVNSAGGGGGAGGTAIYWTAALTPNTGYSIVPGAGGTAGVSSGGNGGTGGNSVATLDVTVTANGGVGGFGAAADSFGNGGNGGTTTNGSVNILGGQGIPGMTVGNSTQAGFGNIRLMSGSGGGSVWGSGANGVGISIAGNGANPYGAGGSGGNASGADRAGGAGAAGIVIVEWVA